MLADTDCVGCGDGLRDTRGRVGELRWDGTECLKGQSREVLASQFLCNIHHLQCGHCTVPTADLDGGRGVPQTFSCVRLAVERAMSEAIGDERSNPRALRVPGSQQATVARVSHRHAGDRAEALRRLLAGGGWPHQPELGQADDSMSGQRRRWSCWWVLIRSRW